MATPIEAGVELLDAVRPGWEGEVDVERLDMGSFEDCVLGQLYGSFNTGWRGLHLRLLDPSAYGFDIVSSVRSRPDYEELTEAWTSVILERREVAR